MQKIIISLFFSTLSTLIFQGCGGGSTSSSNNITTTGSIVNNADMLSLKTKRLYQSDGVSTTVYSYDTKGYLTKIETRSPHTTTTTYYKYFENYHLLKVYENEKLHSITTYTQKTNNTSRFIFNKPLSLNDKVIYNYSKDDAVFYLNNLQIKTYINELEFGGRFNRAERYIYNNNSFISKIQNGHFNVSRSVADQFYNDNNTSFLIEEANNIMPFEVTQSYNYIYNNNTLTQIQYDIYDDGTIDESLDINVTYYPNGNLKRLTLESGDIFEYNSDGFLIFTSNQQNNTKYYYTYTNNYKTIKVTDNAGNTLEEYEFE